MKITHFIFSSLVATTVWAEFNGTYAFFANVNGTLKPLQAENKTEYINMVWGDSLTNASQFTYENRFATFVTNLGRRVATLGPKYGIYLSNYGYPAKLILEDRTSRLLNSFYYSCKYDAVNVIASYKVDETCFLVDVYFVKYDPVNMGPVEGSYKLENVQRIPHSFYVTGKEDLEPLYFETSERGPNHWSLVPFHHGKPNVETPEFFFQLEYAVYNGRDKGFGYASFEWDAFGSYKTVGNPSLSLTENGKVLNRRIFSCYDPKSEDRKIVLDPAGCSNWTEEEIYLLPHDNKTRNGSLRLHKDIDMTPYAFFVKENETWVPLSFREDTNARASVAFMPDNSQNEDRPIEFSFKNNVAFTRNTSSPGFLGFDDNNNLVVSDHTKQTPFDSGYEMKIINYNLYIAEDRSIRVNYFGSLRSPEASLYLLPLNRTSGKPIDNLYAEEDSYAEDDDSTAIIPEVIII